LVKSYTGASLTSGAAAGFAATRAAAGLAAAAGLRTGVLAAGAGLAAAGLRGVVVIKKSLHSKLVQLRLIGF
jgi:hypothetical protein